MHPLLSHYLSTKWVEGEALIQGAGALIRKFTVMLPNGNKMGGGGGAYSRGGRLFEAGGGGSAYSKIYGNAS